MSTRFFALFLKGNIVDSPVFLFRNKRDLERAIKDCRLEDHEVVTFSSNQLLHGMLNGLLYLALTLEDTGVRILEAFRSPFSLRAFLLDHPGEKHCFPGMGWLEPVVRGGKLHEAITRRGRSTRSMFPLGWAAELEPLPTDPIMQEMELAMAHS